MYGLVRTVLEEIDRAEGRGFAYHQHMIPLGATDATRFAQVGLASLRVGRERPRGVEVSSVAT